MWKMSAELRDIRWNVIWYKCIILVKYVQLFELLTVNILHEICQILHYKMISK